MSDVPVERRTYFPLGVPPLTERRACSACGHQTLVPWTLRRDNARRVWRRWVCLDCHAHLDVPEDESA
jgi:hypothetical protein